MEAKKIIITGGATRIGSAIAKSLAGYDIDIIIHFNKSKKSAQKLKAELEEMGSKVYLIKADLLVNEDVMSLIEECKKLTRNKISLLVNNASIFEYDNIKTASLENWDAHFKSNLQAPFFLTQKFAEQAPDVTTFENGEKESNANIINIIDQRVRNLTTDFTTYTLSKTGLWTLTRITAKALSPKIRVNAIGPGPTIKATFQSEENYLKQRKSTPLGRGSEVEDILKTIVQIDTEYSDGFMRLGLLYLDLENYDGAASNLEKSIELDDKDYNKFFNLASAYNHLEKWNEAASSAQSCIDLKKKFGGGWLELGLAEMGRKNRTRAKRHFEEARKDRDWRKMAERKIDEILNPAKYEK